MKRRSFFQTLFSLFSIPFITKPFITKQTINPINSIKPFYLNHCGLEPKYIITNIQVPSDY